MLQRNQLHEYQERAVEWIKSHKSCALFLEMGLGKTVSTLTAIAELKEAGAVSSVLVIAPKRVAERTWTDEIERWEHLKGLTAVKILGTPAQRLKALSTPADIRIINRDNVAWLDKVLSVPLQSFPFDTLVIDELSSFKACGTQRFKAMKHLRTRFNRIIGLTGTPSPNSLMDIWSQLYILDGGERLGECITKYRQTYFTPGRGRGHIVYEWIIKPWASDVIYERIGDICMSMRAEDYLSLPPVSYVNVSVGLTDKERKEYRDFKRDNVLSTAGGVITASSAGVLCGKLQQWTGGAIYTEEGAATPTTPAKLERLKEMLEEIHTPVIIAYHYQHELARLRAEFPQAKTIDEAGVFDAWNRGEVPILLGHPASIGHGLNLQRGGHTIIWYTPTWSLELYEQFNARLARQGQTERVTIYHLIADGTIDQRVLSVLARKSTIQDALMDELKVDSPRKRKSKPQPVRSRPLPGATTSPRTLPPF